jgi:hypothetical protein
MLSLPGEKRFDRVGGGKPLVGMITFRGSCITKDDVKIAKNYLSKIGLTRLDLLVSQFLDFAGFTALEQQPMSMADWIAALDKQAVEKAEKEFEIYRRRRMKTAILYIEQNTRESFKPLF